MNRNAKFKVDFKIEDIDGFYEISLKEKKVRAYIGDESKKILEKEMTDILEGILFDDESVEKTDGVSFVDECIYVGKKDGNNISDLRKVYIEKLKGRASFTEQWTYNTAGPLEVLESDTYRFTVCDILDMKKNKRRLFVLEFIHYDSEFDTWSVDTYVYEPQIKDLGDISVEFEKEEKDSESKWSLQWNSTDVHIYPDVFIYKDVYPDPNHPFYYFYPYRNGSTVNPEISELETICASNE